MITNFECTCGNTDLKKTNEYSDSFGYKAVVCNVCGAYHDLDEGGYGSSNEHEDWRKNYVGLQNVKANNIINLRMRIMQPLFSKTQRILIRIKR